MPPRKKSRRRSDLDPGSVAEHAEAAELADELPPELVEKHPLTFAEALKLAGEKPADCAPTNAKIPYATKLSALFAKVIAARLRDLDRNVFEGVRAGEEAVGAKGSEKKIDVLLATERQGMTLNVSIKTQSFRDCAKGRVKTTKAYCHNINRIVEQELHVEARRSHELFPKAVLIAVVFFPADACFDTNELWKSDAKRTDSHCSSAVEFAHRLRPYASRSNIRDVNQEKCFEAVYIGLHGLATADARDEAPTDAGTRFFDVTTGLPRYGMPAVTLSFEEFLNKVRNLHAERWKTMRSWADSQP